MKTILILVVMLVAGCMRMPKATDLSHPNKHYDVEIDTFYGRGRIRSRVANATNLPPELTPQVRSLTPAPQLYQLNNGTLYIPDP